MMRASDLSSPERMDFSEESSFEMSPLNQINYHTRPYQQKPKKDNRRVSCPPPHFAGRYGGIQRTGSFGSAMQRRSVGSAGDFLDTIDKDFGFLQLGSPPGSQQRPPMVQSLTESSVATLSDASSKSTSSIFSMFSIGSGGGVNPSNADKDSHEDSDDSDETVVSSATIKANNNNNDKKGNLKRRSGMARSLTSTRYGDLSTIVDENDDIDEDRMSTISNKTTGPHRARLKENAKESNRKGKCLCYVHSLILCSAVVIIGYFGSIELHHQWCGSRQVLNITQLESELHTKIFGQHIAVSVITNAFQKFFSSDEGHTKATSVVFSFHGWTGIGKNYISTVVSDLIPSSSITKLIIPLHFPYSGTEHSQEYQESIESWVLTNISSCAVNLFIIDEMDKASKPIIQGLKNALTRIKNTQLNNSRVVIMMLSNTGGTIINKAVFDHLNQGNIREDLQYGAVQEVVLNDPLATWHKMLFDHGLIDYIIPFLPLQYEHVEKCIKSYIKSRGVVLPQKTIRQIAEEFDYFPPGNPIFSKSGCKRVESKTDLYIYAN